MTAATVTGGDHVTAPTASITAAAGGSTTGNTALKTSSFGTNTGDVAIAATLRRGDGQVQQNAIPETITLAASSAAAAPAIAVSSPLAVRDRMSAAWPGGSGLGGSFRTASPTANLLTNGSFETDTTANQPDNWLLAVAQPGTTLEISGQCQQTVAIGGTPTAGSYLLYWTDAFGNNRPTAPLPYNASQAQVQSALQAIAGLEQVQVATTGTSPNYTHTVTFYGVGGAVAALTYTSLLTGGTPTITINTTVAADANSYNGQALKLVGDGSEHTTLYQPLGRLSANTTYFLGMRARVKSGDTVSAGALAVEIVNSIGGSAINDAAGNANTLTINLTTLSSSAWTFFAVDFRIPPSVIQPVYLRLKLTTAITSGKTVYLDELAIVQAATTYPGGPLVAAFAGRLPAAIGDAWTITVSNDFAGKFQNDFNRFFGMADLGLLLPVTGSTLIADSLIA